MKNTKGLVKGYGLPSFKSSRLEDVGASIASHRKSLGLTQDGLGALMGMDKTQISKIEGGRNLTVATINKVLASMNAEASLKILPLPKVNDTVFIEDLVATIDCFADKFGLSTKQAFNYLDRFGGLDFYLADPEMEMSLPMDDTVEAMKSVCAKNGGKI